MVGEGVLLECLNHPAVEEILVINRRPGGISHPKLKEIIHKDFFDLSPIESLLRYRSRNRRKRPDGMGSRKRRHGKRPDTAIPKSIHVPTGLYESQPRPKELEKLLPLYLLALPHRSRTIPKRILYAEGSRPGDDQRGRKRQSPKDTGSKRYCTAGKELNPLPINYRSEERTDQICLSEQPIGPWVSCKEYQQVC